MAASSISTPTSTSSMSISYLKYTTLFFFFAFLQLICSTHAFTPSSNPNPNSNVKRTTTLSASSSRSSSYTSQSRDTILRRNGAHFKLNRFSGKVEFGSTANLVTKFDTENSNQESICEWLSDEKRVALSIWDEKLLTDLGDSVYRLQLMTLQFVTIQLAPSVDTRMWIDMENSNNNNNNSDTTASTPVFQLQSIDFDPNIQLLPGINVPAESLGIQIEVVGELRPSKDGKGVEGRIGFVSGGDLPPPMRLLPEPVLKSASDLICRTVSDFAIRSFQNGARKKYKEFVMLRQKEKSV